jgi:orotidine-5'-phosphate decarboxylase
VRTELAADAVSGHAPPAKVGDAIRAGASHVVIGRSLTRATDPAAVLAQITEELADVDCPQADRLLGC